MKLYLLAASVFVVIWFSTANVFVPSDQWKYSQLAYAISEGNFKTITDDVFSHRYSVYLPTAFFYWLIGVNIISTNLWPMLCALGIGFVVYKSIDNLNAKYFGITFSLFSVASFNYSKQLVPDIIATFLLCTSSFLLYNREKYSNISSPPPPNF